MTVKELLEELKDRPSDMQIFHSSYKEGNVIHRDFVIFLTEQEKSNGSGTFDALCIYPRGRSEYGS